MGLHGTLGDRQAACNLFIGFTITHQRSNFVLAPGQICKQIANGLLEFVLLLSDHNQFVEQMPTERSSNPQFTSLNSHDHILELLGFDIALATSPYPRPE